MARALRRSTANGLAMLQRIPAATNLCGGGRWPWRRGRDRLLTGDDLSAAGGSNRVEQREDEEGQAQGRQQREHRATVLPGFGPARYAGPTAAATVRSSTIGPITCIRRRERPGQARAAKGQQRAEVLPTGAELSPGERGRHLRPPHRRARAHAARRRSSRPAGRVRSRRPASRGREGVSRRGRRHRGRARRRSPSRVASTLSGSTPSKGSSRRRTDGSWKAARMTDSRRPMPWLKPEVTRWAASPRSKRSNMSWARVSQLASRRSRAASWRCSHGVALGTRPPTSGQ